MKRVGLIIIVGPAAVIINNRTALLIVRAFHTPHDFHCSKAAACLLQYSNSNSSSSTLPAKLRISSISVTNEVNTPPPTLFGVITRRGTATRTYPLERNF